MIARTFEGMDRRKFSVYVDDILNHASDFGNHFEIQQETYNRLRVSGLTMKLSKTHMNYEVIKFLGHILSAQGRYPDPSAVEAIQEWKKPESTKEVRSFLGATLYYREYIYNYSDMAMPLYELIRKGVSVKDIWKDDYHGVAVEKIKTALTTKPVLMQIDNTRPFRLKIDACRVGRGIGCILEQQNLESKWQPVSYYSSSLSKQERNYSATELECMALHDCILHYATYLKYIPKFEVFSDHNALRYMVSSENSTTNGRLMRYLLDLQGFNFSLHYRCGAENCDADAVSRLLRRYDEPIFLSEDDLDDSSGVVTAQKLYRARKLDQQNKAVAREAESILRKKDKKKLEDMAKLNDLILSEGVERLESESGRTRFFENLKKLSIDCEEEYLTKTIHDMQLPTTERDVQEVDVEDNLCNDFNCPALSMMAAIFEAKGINSTDVGVERYNEDINLEKTCAHEYRHEDYVYVDESMETIPVMLANLTYDSRSNTEAQKAKVRSPTDVKKAKMKRKEIKKRVKHLRAKADSTSNLMTLMAKKYDTRFQRRVEVENDLSLQQSDDEDQVDNSNSEQNEETDVEVNPLKYLAQVDELEPRRSDRVKRKVDYEELNKYYTEPIIGDEDGVTEHKGESNQEGKDGNVTVRRSRPTVRPKRLIDYEEEVRVQPNWRDAAEPPKEHALKDELAKKYKHAGANKVEVRQSVLLGDVGWGLYASRTFGRGDELCTYEGHKVTPAMLTTGYGNTDYIIMFKIEDSDPEAVGVDAIGE